MPNNLPSLATLIRYYILISTTAAGSGHPTSSLSATDLMTVLFFNNFFRFDPSNPRHPNNDRLIFSKGHASPLFYSLWAAAGAVTEKEMLTLRQFGSPLEGHPTMTFKYTEATTGSLGQGLSIGLGMALNAKYLDKLPYRTYVLLGDSEMAEGSVWETMNIAAYYKLDNLVAIVDVNRLGQRGETMFGYDVKEYQRRIKAFGWETITVDGHNFAAIANAYQKALKPLGSARGKPVAIIAKTIKGKGVSFLENKDGWHGKALKPEELEVALKELNKLNKIDTKLVGKIAKPRQQYPSPRIGFVVSAQPNGEGAGGVCDSAHSKQMLCSTRKAYGEALVKLYPQFSNMVVMDAETSNSTFAETFKKSHPERFFEMFIAEQNMVGTALGLSRRGKIPFISTFATFFTRAFDQIRMSQYSEANIKFVGSHAGVAIGEDGASQMALEDIAMFRTLRGSVVLYPSDAVSTEKLVEEMAKHEGIVYMRTTRNDTAILYDENEEFPIGGSKVLRQSKKDVITVVAAGITLHEALTAYEELKKDDIYIRVIDLYSIKPLDEKTLLQAAKETKAIITVEDHYPEGGLGEAVSAALTSLTLPSLVGDTHSIVPPLVGEGEGGVSRVHSLAVRKMPRSGKTAELLEYENISKAAIVKKVKELACA